MQVSNPFDDARGQFYILRSGQGAFSLWPQQCALPPGWDIVREPQPLDNCNAWLADGWTTLTPDYFAGVRHE